MSELARQYGVSRKTVHKWLNRFMESGRAGLQELSRAPHHQPKAISKEMEQCILEWKAKKPLWGAPKIHAKLPAGWMKWKGHTVQITKALIGQELGLKPVDEGLWALYFESLELGLFDERQQRVRRVKTLNPVQTTP